MYWPIYFLIISKYLQRETNMVILMVLCCFKFRHKFGNIFETSPTRKLLLTKCQTVSSICYINNNNICRFLLHWNSRFLSEQFCAFILTHVLILIRCSHKSNLHSLTFRLHGLRNECQPGRNANRQECQPGRNAN